MELKKKIFEGYTYKGWDRIFHWHNDILQFPNIEKKAYPPIQTKVRIIIKEVNE